MTKLGDFRTVRQVLGKSQRELADMLGVSKRAVQSYEQNQRKPPVPVQKLVALFLYMDWRKTHGQPEPCWVQRHCPVETREKCPSYQAPALGLCWLTTCAATPAAGAPDCLACPTMTQWLDEELKAAGQ